MSEASNAKSGGERMRKYGEENKLRNELSNFKQQVRGSFVLASGRSEADRMKKAITNKYPSLIISSCHHITNTIWPQTQKSHGGHFHRKKLKTSLCDMVVQWSTTEYFMKLNP